MKKYKVYDIYEGKETLGYADTMDEVKLMARDQAEATDGECLVVCAELNPDTGRYRFSEYKEVRI
jgi:hypothetical protein